MRIVFVSNYYTHHQAPFSEAMWLQLKGEYYFIATELFEKERIQMGWKADGFPQFVHQYADEKELCDRLISDADVVIIGSAPVRLIKNRLKNNKLVIIYNERLDKKRPGVFRFLRNMIGLNLHYGGYKSIYCLCSSAFTSYDFSKRNLFKNKCYKWGYFPAFKRYGCIEDIIARKRSRLVSILYVSRLIDWKHPELPIQVAKKLKEEGIAFNMTMIGIGDMEQYVESLIEKFGLKNEVTHLRAMSPENVREYMEKASIFLFTSDRNEGWGAVLNESMNSGCAVVASSEIGSVPYLIKNAVNGYIYDDGDFDDLYTKVKEFCLNQKKREQFGLEAYYTIDNMWNAENAAIRLLDLIKDLQNVGESDRFMDGPCSRADILKDGWFKP